jgi:hypothetical protein
MDVYLVYTAVYNNFPSNLKAIELHNLENNSELYSY